jgi:putative ABC transport system substrate-binding protein
MVENESDIPGMLKQISDKSQLIFIFRDNTIVKHAAMIAQAAKKFKIPLISSDDGSVENGAAFGIGFADKDIGILGAKLASRVLQGEQPCQIPIQTPRRLIVFINPDSLTSQTQWSVKDIQLKARQSGYPSLVITPSGTNQKQLFTKT